MREKQIGRSEHLLRKVWRDNFEAHLLRALPGASILGQISRVCGTPFPR